MDLKRSLKECVLEQMIGKCTNTGSGYVVLVTDPYTLRILSSVCTMKEITASGVLLIQNVQLKRQALPSDTACYFLSPTDESIKLLINDFSNQRKPQFKSVNLFFSSGVSDSQMGMLRNAPNLLARLKQMIELSATDFLAAESRVFSCQRPALKKVLLDKSADYLAELDVLARQITAALVTTKQNPRIRYLATGKGAAQNKALAQKVQVAFNKHVKAMGSEWTPAESRGTLLILDRSFDMIAPLTHEFTYQAQINDMLQVDGEMLDLKYGEDFKGYDSNGDAPTPAPTNPEDLVVLNENDQFYVKLRFLHRGDTRVTISGLFKEFQNSPGGRYQKMQQEGKPVDVKLLSQVAGGINEFNEQFAKLKKHLAIYKRLGKELDAHKFDELADLEQLIITGCNSKDKKERPKKIQKQYSGVLTSQTFPALDKLRLFLTYQVIFGGQDMSALSSAGTVNGPLASELVQILQRMQNLLPDSPVGHYPLNTDEEERKNMFRRVKPNLRETLRVLHTEVAAAAAGRRGRSNKVKLDAKQFPFLKGHSPKESPDKKSKGRRVRRGEQKAGPVSFVFMLGGISYPEIRACYRTCETLGADIVVGSDCIVNPRQYLGQFTDLSPVDFARAANLPPPPKPQALSGMIDLDSPDEEEPASDIIDRTDNGEENDPFACLENVPCVIS